MRMLMSNHEIDQYGMSFVNAHQPELKSNEKTLSVDIEALADVLGMAVTFAEFAEEDTSKIGFLADGIHLLKIKKEGKVETIKFPPRTIVLDERLRNDGCIGRYRFVLAHEISHQLLTQINPRPVSFDNFDPMSKNSYTEYMNHSIAEEQQANRLAAAILMPDYLVDRVLKIHNNGKPILVYGDSILPIESRTVVDNMSFDMRVSYSALLIRMQGLNLITYRQMEYYWRDNPIDIWKEDYEI